MSIPCLTVAALLVLVVSYRVFYTLVRSVRLIGACLVMAAFILIAQNLEKIGHQWISLSTSRFHLFSDLRTLTAPSPRERPEPVTDLTFQRICREDRSFLDEFLQKQNPDGQQPPKLASVQPPKIGRDRSISDGNESILNKDLSVNNAHVKRAEPVTPIETVKRAQLVTQNETPKRAELVRSRQR